MAMIDVQCSKCGKRYGFKGEPIDQPPCPRCGYKVFENQLKEDQKHFDEMKVLLQAKSNEANCLKQRKIAGLTRMQASKCLNIDHLELKEYEEGSKPLPPAIVDAMAELYQVGE